MKVQDEIERSRRYGQQLEELLVKKQVRFSGDRDGLLMGYWALLLDYHAATLTLLSQEFFGAAFALMRPIVEALVRAHIVLCGSAEEVLRIKQDKYRVNFKTVGAQIDKAFSLNGFFENTLKEARDALHSYTHAGMFQITRRFDEDAIKPRYSDGAILNVIEGSTTAIFMATTLVTKHFGFEEEWRTTTEMFDEYNKRPSTVPR